MWVAASQSVKQVLSQNATCSLISAVSLADFPDADDCGSVELGGSAAKAISLKVIRTNKQAMPRMGGVQLDGGMGAIKPRRELETTSLIEAHGLRAPLTLMIQAQNQGFWTWNGGPHCVTGSRMPAKSSNHGRHQRPAGTSLRELHHLELQIGQYQLYLCELTAHPHEAYRARVTLGRLAAEHDGKRKREPSAPWTALGIKALRVIGKADHEKPVRSGPAGARCRTITFVSMAATQNVGYDFPFAASYAPSAFKAGHATGTGT